MKFENIRLVSRHALRVSSEQQKCQGREEFRNTRFSIIITVTFHRWQTSQIVFQTHRATDYLGRGQVCAPYNEDIYWQFREDVALKVRRGLYEWAGELNDKLFFTLPCDDEVHFFKIPYQSWFLENSAIHAKYSRFWKAWTWTNQNG